MQLIRPFTINDAALLSSSIGDGGAEELSGDFSGELELSGDAAGVLELSGDVAGEDEWSASTLYALGDTVKVTATDYHHEFESLSGGTSHVVTMTIASPGVVTWTAHGLAAGTPISFTTTGALPTGLAVGTIYYVLAIDADTFSLAATVGGSAINTSVSQSGVHTAVANPNLNKSPTVAGNEGFWLDLGATNRWAMFDSYNGTQSTAPEQIEVVIETTGRIDAIALLNISAATATIVSAVDGDEVYNETISLVSTAGITDWYAYFFEEIIRRGDLVVTDLPPFVGQTITITLSAPGESVAIGTLIVGQLKRLGVTTYGANVGITDYSRVDRDDFGTATLVVRAFSKRADVKVWTDTNNIDEIQRVLSAYRATPIVFIGDGDFAALQIFGFYRSFEQEISGPNKSYCNLEIEGLT